MRTVAVAVAQCEQAFGRLALAVGPKSQPMARTRYPSDSIPIPLRQLPASALRAALHDGYGRTQLKNDVLAGLVVGVVALPLAMALAIGVGVPPERGLYTAIVGGFVVALLGGSRTQVTGPTAAFIVILAPIYTKFGTSGLLIAGLLGGLILIAMGLFRFGRLIAFIPHPVTTGFTAGIATVIATMQLKDFFGLTLTGTPEHYFERVAAMVEARGSASWAEALVGAFTLAILIWLPRLTRRLPAPLVALPAAALLALFLQHFVAGVHIATIATRFHSMVGGHWIAGIPQAPPRFILPWAPNDGVGSAFVFSFANVRELVPSAFAVAMLGAIESLLSAVVADGMARTRHDPDAELIALGIGNVITPFFGGIPATGAIARTATNIRSGALSPIAAIVHSFTVLAAVLLIAPLIGYLPMAALAGLLLLVAWNMSEFQHFIHTVKVAPKSDVSVLLICYGLTVAIDMVVSVAVGIVLAALLFMRRMAEVTHFTLSEGEYPALPRPLPAGVVIYDIAGPLFFGAAQKAIGTLSSVGDRAKVIVLRMEEVPAMDATGLVALESALERLSHINVLTVICGLQPQPEQVLRRSQSAHPSVHVVFSKDTESAFEVAEKFMAAAATSAR